MDLEGRTVLDVGTGCGFLAVVAAANGATVTATDINQRALDAARDNAAQNGVEIDVVESDLFDGIDGVFDVVCFNAPYIPGSREDRTEEELAWYGGEDGRAVIERFIAGVNEHLADDGTVLLVQSSVTGIDECLDSFEEHGFGAEIVAEEKVSWEELVVIRAWKI